MAITTRKLSRGAGVSAAAAGLLFMVIQLIHPEETLANVATTAWTVTHSLGLTMAVLGLVGVTGLYLRQVRESKLLGLIGFMLFGASFVVIAGFQFVEAVVLPQLAHEAPGYVKDFFAVATGASPNGDVGALTVANAVSAVTYLVGGVLFGVALYRARVLSRWASMLLAVGTAATISVQVLPHSLDRLVAFPTGAALVGLGISLWRDRRAMEPEQVSAVSVPQLDVVGAE